MSKTYLPPQKRRQLLESGESAQPDQQESWNKLKTTIRGSINKVCSFN